MSSEDIKIKRLQSRRRNFQAKVLKDTGDHKGAFALKIRDSRKGEYKRRKFMYEEYEEEDI